MPNSLASMSDEELIEETQRLNAIREAANDKSRQALLAVKYEQDKRSAIAALAEPLAALPEELRAGVLAEALKGGGNSDG